MPIFEMAKSSINSHVIGIGYFDPYIGMNVSIYVNLWSFVLFWCLSYGYSRNFTKIKIVYLWHKDSMIGV